MRDEKYTYYGEDTLVTKQHVHEGELGMQRSRSTHSKPWDQMQLSSSDSLSTKEGWETRLEVNEESPQWSNS
jgi:hypothetical protein